ncbi:MAG: ammonium transporter [Lachnospiraceae bacterium]|nr:ammonium transporter [Lachnospiraceae bacterium]
MYSAVNTIWIILGAILMFMMQAGFAMVETGFTRAKNAGNIVMKNVMDFAIGSLAFFFVGFGLMYGNGNDVLGWFDFGLSKDYTTILPEGVNIYVFFIYQTMFCATAATIVSGAMAGRTKFKAYCLYSLIISMVVFPVSGHWIWGNGWLQKLGFHDFAGSTAVHLVGGTAALAGVLALGPRIGKYTKDGKSRAIPGHSITLGALGVFLLWFGWFGFNACSTMQIDTDSIMVTAGKIMVNTNLSAVSSAVTAMIYSWIRYKKTDITLTLNAALAGLVSITAGCDAVSTKGSVLIGFGAGIVIILGIEFIDKVLKADDPVGAISVHGVCGAYGTIMVGLMSVEEGLFYTGNAKLLIAQLAGVFSVGIYVFVIMTVVFQIMKHTMGIRVSKEDEVKGLDKAEHGLASAYADFGSIGMNLDQLYGANTSNTDMDVFADKIPKITPSKTKLTKVTIIMNQDRFEALKSAMNSIGVTGMTVTNVLGCGIQKGAPEHYRGSELNMQLLPKVQVDIVITKVPLEDVVSVAEKVLYTGHIGDGKIFVYDVENVIKVRTGEWDYDALQGMD